MTILSETVFYRDEASCTFIPAFMVIDSLLDYTPYILPKKAHFMQRVT